MRSPDSTPAGATRNGPPRRARLVAILAESDELAPLADLVGATALSDRQRVALLAGRLARDTVLQQSALSPRDAYCSQAKTAALVDALLATVDALQNAVAAGAAAEALEQLDFGPVTRAREEMPPDNASDAPARRDAVVARIRAATR